MMPSAARIPLRLLILPVLLSPCGCVIQIYEIENDTVAQEPVYTVSNNYQTVVGQRNADIPIYLKVADPLNACDAEKLPPAPSLSEGSQMSVVFLLADDEACARRKEKPSTMRKWQFAQDSVDGDEFAKKILNAQAKGYSGVIVQASLFEDRTKPGAHGSVNLTAWPTRSRTEPFPVAIPQALTSRLTVDVHFVSYEEGKRLTKFAYYPSSEIRYRLNFTLPTESARASSHEDDGILPGFSNWTISQLQRFPELKSTDASDSETTTEFDPIAFIAELRSDLSQRYGGPLNTLDYSTTTETFSSSSDSSGSFDKTLFIAIFVPLVCAAALYSGCRWLVRRHRMRAAEERARVREALEEQEIARMLAYRQRLVQSFIENFMARLQEAEQQEHLRANGVPLSLQEMEELNQVTVNELSDEMCPTCQQTFNAGELKIVLPCNHAGHKACLTTWLTTYSRNCPVCRQSARNEATPLATATSTFSVHFPDSPIVAR